MKRNKKLREARRAREAGRREKMSDGHSDAGGGDEHDTDSGDMTDDGEVELNLPRKDAMERDLPGEDVRDLPGATASGTSVTNQEERHRLEPPNGARSKTFGQCATGNSHTGYCGSVPGVGESCGLGRSAGQ